jgi:hypothetical protein
VCLVIRKAAELVFEINKMANFLMADYVIDLVQRQQPIPLRLVDMNQTMWNRARNIVTTIAGEWHDTWPTARKPRAKKVKAVDGNEPPTSKTLKMGRKRKRKEAVAVEKKKKKKKKQRKGKSKKAGAATRRRRGSRSNPMPSSNWRRTS